ncbi:DUF3945 domain-containing protein [Epilithonimonas zeae]|uniref:Uncharacterized protein n=1 Tax=Epilithonimonas zeae TaxID=1416779 RepID=A0A1N6FWE1_9FLAO|nr:DUF3945 domain-containing protein [Epilithonimonas zeae]SIN99609.1 Protein of unknown function [Epilithonimonas zeae]
MNNTGNQTVVSEVSTLLVLRHSSNTIGMVKSVSADGEVVDVTPENKDEAEVMRIDSSEHSFAEFYSDFYRRLKDPEDYSFFKVREFEAYETAVGLQSYLAGLSAAGKEDLSQYEVFIEAVESIRNQKFLGNDGIAGGNFYDQRSSFSKYNPNYRFQVEDVNWNSISEMGLDMEILGELGALEPLLKGFKTPMLVAVQNGAVDEGNSVDARLQLRLDDNGEVVLHVHRVQKRVDFRKKFMGHRFSKEDRKNLLNSGNMGRVVDLVNPVTGEMAPSLVSLDKLTNELFSLRMEFVRIPKVVCGVSLSTEQRETLRSGKPLFVENMVSRRNLLFNSTLQFNAEKQWLEFFFNRKVKEGGFEWCVPATFRGVTLRRWQIDKLKVGETAYIRGLTSKKGKKYQGYIRFDKETGRINFSFKKPCK